MFKSQYSQYVDYMRGPIKEGGSGAVAPFAPFKIHYCSSTEYASSDYKLHKIYRRAQPTGLKTLLRYPFKPTLDFFKVCSVCVRCVLQFQILIFNLFVFCKEQQKSSNKYNMLLPVLDKLN